ncbi:cytochrome P450 2U1-like [Saccoglossus kowalevskii]
MASDAALPYLQAIVFLITVAILAFSLSLRRRKRNLPPGPAGWPLIGCLLQCGSQVPLKFHEWSRKYGNVMSLQLGSQLVIVLSSYDVIKEAFVKNSNIFSSRPKSYAVARVTKEKGINTPWVKWKHTHKFISKTFREFGLGKQIMAERVRTEGDILVEYIDSRSNTPINLKHVFANAVSNITCSMLFGKRFDYEDPDFKLLLQMSNQNVVTMMQASVLTFFPFLWYLPTQVKRNFITAQSELVSYMKQKIIERREQFTGEEPENIIDAFFLEDKEAEWDDDKIIELVHTVKGIFIAGTDSTAATLLWAILYLVLHQEIQDRCYSEIVKAIGYERHPEIADRASLPYVDATGTAGFSSFRERGCESVWVPHP